MKKYTIERLKDMAISLMSVELKFGGLPIRECMPVLGYTSTSATVYALNKMAGAGLLKKYNRGHGHIYRIAR